MTIFSDLSAYSYWPIPTVGKLVRNVGWLGASTVFQTGKMDETFLNRLWHLCTVSIHQMRGLHECELCGSRAANVAERNAEKLLLGSAEILVFARQNVVYVAPNLIYHYVDAHNYVPPAEFVDAVHLGPIPPDRSYLEKVSELGESCSPTPKPEGSARPFRFVKTAKGIIRVEE